MNAPNVLRIAVSQRGYVLHLLVPSVRAVSGSDFIRRHYIHPTPLGSDLTSDSDVMRLR